MKLEEIVNEAFIKINEAYTNHASPEEIKNIIQLAIKKHQEEESTVDSFHAETFKQFYERYGKKVGRIVAQTKWVKLKKSEIEKILDTLPDFILANPDPQFRPHPAKYLKDKRWNDELSTQTVYKSKTFDDTKRNTWSYI